MFHSFNTCIFSKIVGAEFSKSLKSLFFRIKKVGSYDFFKNSIQYTFYDLLEVCKVLKNLPREKWTQSLRVKIRISIATRDNSRVTSYFKNPATQKPCMLFK